VDGHEERLDALIELEEIVRAKQELAERSELADQWICIVGASSGLGVKFTGGAGS
jgi:hypothetical protein